MQPSSNVLHLPSSDQGQPMNPQGSSDAVGRSPSKPALSSAAQQTLELVMIIKSSQRKTPVPLKSGSTSLQAAAAFYSAASSYYHHPERGMVQIQWTNVEACLRTNYPEVLDRISRAEVISDAEFDLSWRIACELMHWSRHLVGDPAEQQSIETVPSVQPRTASGWMKICAAWSFHCVVAMVLPKRSRPTRKDHP